MKIKVIHCIKNLGFSVLKLGLIVLLCSFILNTGLSFWNDLKADYHEYTFVGGFENFGVETTASCIDKKDGLIYEYIVNEETYTFIRDDFRKSSDTIKVYYDLLEPDIAIETVRLTEINDFYSNIFKDISMFYIEVVCAVFIFSLIWYILDLLKYNKLIWKDAV
jgi:hypothetical protein